MNVDFPLLAAIRAASDAPVDDILRAVFRALIAEGRSVVGFLQRDGAGRRECCGRIELEELDTGACHVISQALGSGARGCRLDPQALAAVAVPLLSRLDDEPDLVILNRFGRGESEGQGLRAVIEEASARGIPVLTAVRESYVQGWQAFAGELGVLLPPRQDGVVEWAQRATVAAKEAREAA